MPGRLTRRTLAASAAVVVVVASVLALLLATIASLQDARREARRTETVLVEANRLETLALDLQTGERGFALTGRAEFLAPWESARAALPGQQRELEGLVVDPAQRERLRDLNAAIRSYLDDWSAPLVSAARENLADARARIATGEGQRRMDGIRAEFDRFDGAQSGIAARAEDDADRNARRAILIAGGGLVGILLLLVAFVLFIARSIVAPINRVAAAARRLSAGDLAVRVAEAGRDEVGDLARAFNTMADSLEESRDELESQNAELELQAAELEEQQGHLRGSNDELAAKQAELERALGELETEKRRVETLFDFSSGLGAETDLGRVAERVLTEMGEFAGAEIGTLYVRTEATAEAPALVQARGIDAGRLPATLAEGIGLAGRALAEARAVTADYGEAELRVSAFGQDVAVRNELHVPLGQSGRKLGVVTLARVGDRPFERDEVAVLEHLADQAAVALSNAVSYREVRRLLDVNRAVLDATPVAISMVDAEGRRVLMNTAFERLASEYGLDERGAGAERDGDRLEFAEWLDGFLRDGDAGGVEEFEGQDGRSFRVYSAQVDESDRTPRGRIVVIEETTSERQVERMKTELVATVSHELRTPLASIVGFAELLSERDPEPEARKRYVRTIHNEARRLTDLINDFLDLQRMEEGRFRLSIEPFDLDELLREEVELFSGQSPAHALDLRVPDQPLRVAADRDRIAQVLANLLSNAIKYSPAGGPVSVVAAQADGAVRVAVTDSGVGIPAGQQERLFEKFFRVDSSDTREIGGTGLGLALCREIVEAHGGQIGFETMQGRGSTFSFSLPAAQRMPAARRLALVIADDATAASLLGEALGEEGFDVEIAASGEEGLAAAKDREPALVCLDVALAGPLDGWQVLERLKAHPATANTPILVCTGGIRRDEAAALGAADFLSKPFSALQLHEVVARVLPSDATSVLVVDDDEAVRGLVRETLAPVGVSLHEAADGDEALVAVSEHIPDAIVLDLMMPRVDGFTVLERLGESEQTRSIPVIVLTARRLSTGERRILRERAAGLLEKSAYSALELRRLIRRAVGDQTLDRVEQP